jgi:hypothetical protein
LHDIVHLHRMRRTLLLVLLVPLLSGCTSDGPGAAKQGEDVTIITDPNQGRLDPTMGPHLHDYWGSSKELTVVDQVISVGGILWAGSESIPVAEFRPESGDLVPQGASEVRATITWTEGDSAPGSLPNKYEWAELWVKRANESQPLSFGEVAKGDTVVVPTGNESNDLPHQLLSAWVFQLVLFGHTGPTDLYNVSYTGDVTLTAVAERGTYAIPLFPGHPDQWQNRTEILLFELSGDMMFDGDTASGNWRCYVGDPGCPFYMVPADGAIVPIDADHVTVVLERQVPVNPTRLGIKFHSSLTREFEAPPAPAETMDRREYTIPVGDGGDGPYAKQSQWEFLFYASDPVPDTAVYEQFTLTITAHKDP